MHKIKTVLDTNIFVSSFFGGNPGKVVESWKDEKIILCITQSVLDEYIRVLAEFKNLDIQEQIRQLLDLFATGYEIEFILPRHEIRTVSDPSDDKFIECAVSAGAQYIISGVKALLKIRKYQNISILSPALFLQVVKKY
ncbi:MAG: putative toxin-antitoxin system toxin component, PIN family [Candidatus Omnitrophica bacterium]|nr:putative toxin-antitoxin system toxin component, PIN family [Candidatus Omnitrophota bacterium]